MMAASIQTASPNPLLPGSGQRQGVPSAFGQGFPGMAGLPGYPPALSSSYPYYPLNAPMGAGHDASQVPALTNGKYVVDFSVLWSDSQSRIPRIQRENNHHRRKIFYKKKIDPNPILY